MNEATPQLYEDKDKEDIREYHIQYTRAANNLYERTQDEKEARNEALFKYTAITNLLINRYYDLLNKTDAEEVLEYSNLLKIGEHITRPIQTFPELSKHHFRLSKILKKYGIDPTTRTPAPYTHVLQSTKLDYDREEKNPSDTPKHEHP